VVFEGPSATEVAPYFEASLPPGEGGREGGREGGGVAGYGFVGALR